MLKTVRRAYRIAHAHPHPIYERHKAFICNYEYIYGNERATPLLSVYAGVVCLARLLSELRRRFSLLHAELWCPLHGSLLATLVPIPRGAVSVRVEKRVAYYLIAFNTREYHTLSPLLNLPGCDCVCV